MDFDPLALVGFLYFCGQLDVAIIMIDVSERRFVTWVLKFRVHMLFKGLVPVILNTY